MASPDVNQPDPTSESTHPENPFWDGTSIASLSTKRTERVFPIRIHSDNLTTEQPKEDQTHSQSEIVSGTGTLKDSNTPDNSLLKEGEESTAPLISTIELSEGHPSSDHRYVTNKFNYVLGGEGNPSTPLAEGKKLYRCEDEPIHIPGAIQRFGALIAVREEGDSFIVCVVSENSQSVTGLEPEALFQLHCFTEVLNPPDRNEFILRAHILQVDSSRRSPDVFSISLTPTTGTPIHVFCAMHLNTESDLFICEFELDLRTINPVQQLESGFPDEPIEVIHGETTEADRTLSTTCRSEPLNSLQIVRANPRQLTPMDTLQIQSEIQAQLSSSINLTNLGDVIVGLVHDLTGFHRVMIYQFDETGAGSVVSELVDPRASRDIYRGVHFPHSDIPKQARALYMKNTIRILYDRDQETAQLVCRTFDDAKVPLNLGNSYLRAMSPIHLKYLANMGVQASMSISLIVENKLWGLVSCHNYGSKSGIHVSLPIREICRGLGEIASSNIQRFLFASRIDARRRLTNAPPESSPFAYITSSTPNLLNMFGADFGFLVIKSEARTIGKLFAYSEAIRLLHYIRHRAQTSIFHSHAIGKDFPEVQHTPGNLAICGMLVIPLSLSGTDFLVFFRKEQLKEITWAGNPHEKRMAAETKYLEPRSSFSRWSEKVVGTSRQWTEEEVESAAILATLYGRFIEVWRQKEAIVQRNRLTRLLISNAGHEARTPLNSIINYLEVVLEEELSERARSHLETSLEASKSLVFVVTELLQLTEAEKSDFQVHEDNVDLRAMVSEVVAAFREEILRRNANVQIEDDRDVPQLVRCDRSGLRQTVSNLLANALQSSEGGYIRIKLEHVQTTQANSVIKISFDDNGKGFSEEQLDSLFRDFEQILDDDDNPAVDEQDGNKNPTMPLQINIGLATVARFVRLHSGQISMSSEGKGKGTAVSITIPFRKALLGDFGRKRISPDTFLPTPPTDTVIMKVSRTPGSSSSLSMSSQAEDIATSSSSAPDSKMGRYPFPISAAGDEGTRFNVLVAEDNPLNSRLLETRLKKRGHVVRVAVDGKACVDAFKSSPREFDIILMDIQMPLVDGDEATRMIREIEKEPSSTIEHSPRIKSYGRIPIIAVSASLAEQNVQKYIELGFDGWMLKPIDFKRLEVILAAIADEKLRDSLFYTPGSWIQGGWFEVGSESRL